MKYIFLGGHDSLGGGEDILSSWRKHLELLGGGQDTPGSPHTVRSSTPLDGGIEGGNRPCSTPSIEDSPHRNTGKFFFIKDLKLISNQVLHVLFSVVIFYLWSECYRCPKFSN